LTSIRTTDKIIILYIVIVTFSHRQENKIF
jgi:hypothetical protein